MGLSGFSVLFRFNPAIRQRAKKEEWAPSDRTHPAGWSDGAHSSFFAVVKNTEPEGNVLGVLLKTINLLVFKSTPSTLPSEPSRRILIEL